MNKNLNYKGASKKKGAAESEELTEKGPVDGMDESGAGKKKGAAQEINVPNNILEYGKKLRKKKDAKDNTAFNDEINAGMLDSIYMDVDKSPKAAIDKYGKQYGQRITDASTGAFLGRNMEKGKIEVSEEDMNFYRNHAVNRSDEANKRLAEGANRMGFTQNFGAARQNGYAKGAAKVASIMNFGAAKAKGAAEYGGKKGDDSKSKKDYEG